MAMKASGHIGAARQQGHLDLQGENVAKALILLQDGNADIDRRHAEWELADSRMEKEGARWCRWSSKPVWGS